VSCEQQPEGLTENCMGPHTTRHYRGSGNPGAEIGTPALDPRFSRGRRQAVGDIGLIFGQILSTMQPETFNR
jgi:hypothetical protein